MTHESLLARLREAKGPDREMDAAIAGASGQIPAGALRMHGLPGAVKYATGAYEAWVTPDYTSSVDAILALIERELPAWGYDLSVINGKARAGLWRPQALGPSFHGYGEYGLALALCIAFVSALSAIAASEGEKP